MSDEKNKPPTQKKLDDARDDGETPKSADATAAGVVLAAGLMLYTSAGFMNDRMARLFQLVWDRFPRADEPLAPVIAAMGYELLLMTIPFALATMMGAVLSLVLQGAFTMSAKPVMLKLEAVSPAAGLKKIFSMRGAIESLTMLLKSTTLFILLAMSLKSLLPLLVGATARSPELLGQLMWQVLLRLLFIGVGFFVVFGLIDYGLQRFLFMRDQRMSEEDIKRENKEQNGNPEVKQARREMAHELLMEDPKKAVAGASMVVANPTHYAVAIFYRKGGVPQVVAKGIDDVALELRQHAELCGVPVIVNPPLARTLFNVPLGAGIPRECFQVVGLMLHWVDQLHASQRAARQAREGSGP